MSFSDDFDSAESEMMSLLPIMLYAEEESRRRSQNFRQFVPTAMPSLTRPASTQSPPNGNANLNNTLLHLLDTGRFSDVQFQVGVDGYCFNCHKAIVGGRSEVLAIAMERRWAENSSVLDKTVIRLPETDVQAFKVFVKVGRDTSVK